ncbi:MAG: hypothetical protein H6510_00420 [Acidobacteria bacterium]|nr:hypothetical protein [Acidobacteriota bacterium]MCB9396252.1 hypothetical protein [Acidobacteriota bacterium]
MNSFAFIANGNGYLVEQGKNPTQIQTQFGQETLERRVSVARRNEWKTQGAGAQFMMGGMIQQHHEKDIVAEQFVSIAAGQAAECYFSTQIGSLSVVLRYDRASQIENRLIHTADYQPAQLSIHAEKVVLAVREAEVGCHLALMNSDGSDMQVITEGDVIDTNPHWVPGQASTIIYQSAGIARNAAGIFCGTAPFSIQQVNVATGRVETVLEDARFDFVFPRITADGTLFFVRKPYQSAQKSGSFLQSLTDFVLFPFRLLKGILGFLNIFTMRYRGKSLSSSRGARQKHLDPHLMFQLGLFHQAQQVVARNDEGDPEPFCAPNSWQLISRSPGGEEKVLLDGVLHFDVRDSQLLATNGKTIWHLDPSGQKKVLFQGAHISSVCWLPPISTESNPIET